MHNCEEFRERVTEHIIDRQDLAAWPESQRELLICSSCSDFYAESRELMEALSSVDLSISENQWWGIEGRLRVSIVQEEWSRRSYLPASEKWGIRTVTPFLLAAAALFLITVGLARLAMPVHDPSGLAEPTQSVYVDHVVPLDPVTVDFLEESELLLRNVMKIEPADVEDLADAKKTAREQLAGIKLRKEAAAELPPVVDVIDTYETVLRDLRNLDDRNAAEEIPDIQRRIKKNALIANMKAFQPSLLQVSFGSQ